MRKTAGFTMNCSTGLCLLVFLLFLFIAEGRRQVKVLDVTKYGAVADKKTDNQKAFLRAWKDACKWKGESRIVVPSGTFKLGPTEFKGPCKGSIAFQVTGVLLAPTGSSSFNFDHWITFRYLNHLTVTGGGTFDGQGESGWKNCGKTIHCPKKPVSMRFDFVNNSVVDHITSRNSKNFHINVFACNNMNFSKITILAPADSPNTDGIHIAKSSFIYVHDSLIATGDDCISLGEGSQNVDVFKVVCGPGHGISVGSLGYREKESSVHGLHVKNCTFRGTDNGLRIKTWASRHATEVSNITYEDIIVENSYNPIIIDQEYCPSKKCQTQVASQVQIRNVKYTNIKGTSRSKNAVSLLCSKIKPCHNVVLKDVKLRYTGEDGPAISSCANANIAKSGKLQPLPCRFKL